MKKLIVSCDGTWNSADDRHNDLPSPTNVVKLHNCLASTDGDGNEQRRYYHTGVGTEGNFLDRVKGGMYGKGIGQNVMSAYRWIAANYETGDQIFLFGFSRGAFTARSVAGLIGACQLPDLAGLEPAEVWERIEKAYNRYRVKIDKRSPIDWPIVPLPAGATYVSIQLVGVWDTVGSLGIPDDLGLLNILDRPSKWSFHDYHLGEHIRYARHALAIDELRASFTPTIWTDQNDQELNGPAGSRVRQLWFPGVHSDIGGGYASCGLSDNALHWMIEEAELAGLVFNPKAKVQVHPKHQGVLHDSLGGVFKALRTRPRNRPWLEENSPHYHMSAWLRQVDPPISQCPYHSSARRLRVGETCDPVSIYAHLHWNPTGLFLEEGATYEFHADGEWIDKSIACGPNGTKDGKFKMREIVHLAGSLLGKLEQGFQKTTGNERADFITTRRDESSPWFCLMGAIANDGEHGSGKSTNPNVDGSPFPHQTFRIGAGPVTLTLKPTESGFLYAFANDAWHFYDNNRGSVVLTVKRVG